MRRRSLSTGFVIRNVSRASRIALGSVLAAPAVLAGACGTGGGDVATTDAGGEPDASTPGLGASSLDAGSSEAASSDAAAPDAGPAEGGPVDAAALTTCAATVESDGGTLSFGVAGVSCFNFTPADTGEPATGENATLPEYALRPGSGPAPSRLVLFLIGSGGHPSGVLKAGPVKNFYAAAVAQGNAVFGVSYKNDASLGDICQGDDSCFFPTRESILLGQPELDAGLTATIDESVVDRTARALRFLAAGDPAGGWGAFLTTPDPSVSAVQAIDWTKVVAAGHSQGGGHAAALGKLFPLARVIQLSSTCDSAGRGPASWTNGAVAPWASDPTQFYGFATPSSLVDGSVTGDTTCPFHTLNWTNLGMVASHRDDDASTCAVDGDTHNESLWCPDNYPAWLELLK